MGFRLISLLTVFLWLLYIFLPISLIDQKPNKDSSKGWTLCYYHTKQPLVSSILLVLLVFTSISIQILLSKRPKNIKIKMIFLTAMALIFLSSTLSTYYMDFIPHLIINIMVFVFTGMLIYTSGLRGFLYTGFPLICVIILIIAKSIRPSPEHEDDKVPHQEFFMVALILVVISIIPFLYSI